MNERGENPTFEQALSALRLEVQKLESGQTEQEEFPGQKAFEAAIEAIRLIPEAPDNLVEDLRAQSNHFAEQYRSAGTDSEKDAVRTQVSKTLEILLSRIDPAKRASNYGISPEEKKANQDAINKLKNQAE